MDKHEKSKQRRTNAIIMSVFSVILVITVIIAGIIAFKPDNLTVMKSPDTEQPITGRYGDDYYGQSWAIRKDSNDNAYIVLQNPNYSSCVGNIRAVAKSTSSGIIVRVKVSQESGSDSCVDNGDKKYNLYTITAKDANKIDLSKTAQLTLSTSYKDNAVSTYSSEDTVSKDTDSTSYDENDSNSKKDANNVNTAYIQTRKQMRIF